MDEGKESGRRGWETPPKPADASTGSQRGHRTRSVGNPCTWGRATACRCFGANVTECEPEGPLGMSVKGKRNLGKGQNRIEPHGLMTCTIGAIPMTGYEPPKRTSGRMPGAERQAATAW